jgi:hypothetical protein
MTRDITVYVFRIVSLTYTAWATLVSFLLFSTVFAPDYISAVYPYPCANFGGIFSLIIRLPVDLLLNMYETAKWLQARINGENNAKYLFSHLEPQTDQIWPQDYQGKGKGIMVIMKLGPPNYKITSTILTNFISLWPWPNFYLWAPEWTNLANRTTLDGRSLRDRSLIMRGEGWCFGGEGPEKLTCF